ncbi:tetratricopeptide repeat protein [bacterium]|nr:tetratricopeptide repeat protein [bacterium]
MSKINNNIFKLEILFLLQLICFLAGCENAEKQYGLGMQYLQEMEYDEAIEHFTKYIELRPDDEYGYYNRGFAYFQLEKYDKVISDMEKTLNINTDNAEAFKMLKSSTYELFKMKNQKPKSKKATAIVEEPTDYESYMEEGRALYKEELYDEAIVEFTSAIELSPEKADAYIERGRSYKRANEYSAALSDFNKAIALEPDNVEAYKRRRNFYTRLAFYCYVGSGEMKEFFDPMEETFDKIKEIFRDKIEPMPYDDYKTYCNLVIKDCNKLLELKPDSKSSLIARGTAYFYLEDYEKALEDFNKVLAIDPNNSTSLYFKVKSCEKLRLKDEEIKTWKKIIEIAEEKGEKDLEMIRARLDGRSPVVYAKERIKILENE